jgi:hypothetical protein
MHSLCSIAVIANLELEGTGWNHQNLLASVHAAFLLMALWCMGLTGHSFSSLCQS